MFQLLILAVLQSGLLASGQVLLKLSLVKMAPFGWNSEFWYSLLVNWQFAACGLCFGAASLLWMYIVKHFPLSMAYPMLSLSYVFGLIAAQLVFHEQVGLMKWFGVGLIIAGCIIVAK